MRYYSVCILLVMLLLVSLSVCCLVKAQTVASAVLEQGLDDLALDLQKQAQARLLEYDILSDAQQKLRELFQEREKVKDDLRRQIASLHSSWQECQQRESMLRQELAEKRNINPLRNQQRRLARDVSLLRKKAESLRHRHMQRQGQLDQINAQQQSMITLQQQKHQAQLEQRRQALLLQKRDWEQRLQKIRVQQDSLFKKIEQSRPGYTLARQILEKQEEVPEIEDVLSLLDSNKGAKQSPSSHLGTALSYGQKEIRAQTILNLRATIQALNEALSRLQAQGLPREPETGERSALQEARIAPMEDIFDQVAALTQEQLTLAKQIAFYEQDLDGFRQTFSDQWQATPGDSAELIKGSSGHEQKSSATLFRQKRLEPTGRRLDHQGVSSPKVLSPKEKEQLRSEIARHEVMISERIRSEERRLKGALSQLKTQATVLTRQLLDLQEQIGRIQKEKGLLADLAETRPAPPSARKIRREPSSEGEGSPRSSTKPTWKTPRMLSY